MKHALKIAAAAALLLVLAGCVAGSAESHHAASGGDVSQFFLGFWHGIIAPVTVIVEVINRLLPRLLPWHAQLYESSGTGVAYDVGFYLGLAGGPPIVINTWSRRR